MLVQPPARRPDVSLYRLGTEPVFFDRAQSMDPQARKTKCRLNTLLTPNPSCECQRLISVPGVGPLISTGIVAAIGSGEAFERGRDFAAWLGLVPRQHSTGGRSILCRISKRGSKYLRTLLIQAARVLLMRPHNWPRFSFGAWLKTASERLHRNKLAVALANKLARIAWSVLRHDKTFDTHLEAAAI